MKNKKIKLIIFISFLFFLFGGAFMMYLIFLKGNKAVDPNSVKPRTQENIKLIDSLKNAGFYGEKYKKDRK